jgi:hypothetical protein
LICLEFCFSTKTRPTSLTVKSTLFWTNIDSISVLPATVTLMLCEIQDALSKCQRRKEGVSLHIWWMLTSISLVLNDDEDIIVIPLSSVRKTVWEKGLENMLFIATIIMFVTHANVHICNLEKVYNDNSTDVEEDIIGCCLIRDPT